MTSPSLLEPMDVGARLGRLRLAIGDAGCDGLLVTSMVNIRYLTGFTGSAALVLVPAGDRQVLFVTDGRYGDQASAELAAAGVDATIEVSNENQAEIVGAAAASLSRVGLEADTVTWAQQRLYAEEWFPTAELVPTDGIVASLRLVKDPGEVARIERAAAVADAAFAVVIGMLAEGPTEHDVALALDDHMRGAGAEGPSFETIVASGPSGARPHHRPTSRVIAAGDLVVMDFGARVEGYCSDMTRTVLVGDGSDTQRRMWDVVVEAQAAGVAAVVPGVAAKTVDQTCREVIEAAGWGDAFLHATGHGVGLEIHERPRAGRTSDATIEAGNVVTVEPGVYLPDHGGVRIEDTLFVGADSTRALTRTPKTLGV